MHVCVTSARAQPRHTPRLLMRRCGLISSVMLLLSGCLTSVDRGDHAFEQGRYEEALTLYEQGIDQGQTRDPQVYYRAAVAATRVGSFAAAERHYSRALRYGGGSEVARALAELYIQTSNYSSAVRVLQVLLNDPGIEPQPIYNNLGVALMYAGDALDAESYLLVAQQLNPKDPNPYVNLGLLYDRHLRRPERALGFYKCYIKMMSPTPQRTVDMRMRELSNQHSAESLACGKPYRPELASKRGALREAFQDDPEVLARLDAKAQASVEPIFSGEPADTARREVRVDAGGTLPAPSLTREAEPSSPTQRARAEARRALALKEPSAAIEAMSAIPKDMVNAEDAALMARAHELRGDEAQAEVWLRTALQLSPGVSTLTPLLRFLQERKRQAQLLELCSQFADDEESAPAVQTFCRGSR